MRIYQLGIIFVYLMTLSACVTQQLVDEDNKQIIQSEATQNEIALTRISLGLGYLEIGDTTQAKFNLEKAKLFAPKLIEVYTAFAHYYQVVGETQSAIASYEKALEIDKNNPDTLNNYGAFLCKEGELIKAEQQFLKAIAIPTYLLVAESYENLSWCHLDANKFTEAEFYLEKAILHSPKRTSSLLQMALLHYAKGDYKKSVELMQRHDTAKRRYTPSSLALSYRLQYKLKDRQKAKGYANILLSTFASSYEAKQYLDNGLTNSEGDKLAERYRKHNKKIKLKRVVKLAPKKPTVAKQTVPSNSNVAKQTKQAKATVTAAKKQVVNTYPLTKETDGLTVKETNVVTRKVQKAKTQVPVKSVPAVPVQTVKTKQAITQQVIANQPVNSLPISSPKIPSKIVPPVTTNVSSQEKNNSRSKAETNDIVEYDLSFEDDHNLTDYLDTPEEPVIERAVVNHVAEVNSDIKTTKQVIVEKTSPVENNNVNDDELLDYANSFDDENALIDYNDTAEPESELAQFANDFDDQFTGYETNEVPNDVVEEKAPESIDVVEPIETVQAQTSPIENNNQADDSASIDYINSQSIEDDPNEYDNYFETENELIEYSSDYVDDSVNEIQEEVQKGLGQSNTTNTNKATPNIPTYVVNKGDSLFRISRENSVSVESLLTWNNLEDASRLKEGDVIYLADPRLARR